MKISISTILYIILACCPGSLFASEAVVLTDAEKQYAIGHDIYLYEDKKRELTYNEIRTPSYSRKFKKNTKNFNLLGFTKSAYWARFTVTNNAKSINDWFFSLNNNYYEKIDVYIERDSRLVRHIKSGDFYHPKTRTVKYRFYTFKLNFKSNATYTVYVRLFTHKRILFYFTLHSPTGFAAKNRVEYVYLGIYYGIILVMILYNFFLFISTRDKNYLFYIFHVTAFLIWQLSYTGIGYYYIWQDFPRFNLVAVFLLSPVVLLCILLFSSQFLMTKKNVPFIHKIIQVLMVLLGIELLIFSLQWITPLSASIANILNSIVTLTVITAAISSYVRGYKPARFFIIAWIIFGFGMVSFNLIFFNILPYTFLTEYSIQIGSAAEVILFSLALGDRINLLKEEKESALAQYKELNQRLELLVEERTEKLRMAHDEIKNSLSTQQLINDNLLEAHRELDTVQKMLKDDLHMASQIQKAFLKLTLPANVQWDIAFYFQPMREVSGDFYDFYYQNDQLNGVSLFDVSGHGVASGLITLMAKYIIDHNFKEGNQLALNRIMTDINTQLTSEIENINNYLTGIILRFQNGAIEYVNAAHTDILLKNGKTGAVSVIDSNENDAKGFFLGIPFKKNEFGVMTVAVETDDTIILFTDGIEESVNEQNEHFGIQRIINSLENCPVAFSAQEQLNLIIKDFNTFLNGRDPQDDITLILLKKI